MEIDQQDSNCEYDQEEQSGVNQSTTRSYECNFCKRGFTNAQALGGHMNIHRKEKAKLKQSKSTSSLSLSPNNKTIIVDTPKMIPVTNPPRLPWVVSPSTREGDHGRSGGGREETLISEEVQQLPLFVENPSNMDQNLEIIHQVRPTTEVDSELKLGSSFKHGSSVSELDLELRLGPEPPNSTPSSLSTCRTTNFF